MSKIIDLTGKRFGRLLVLRLAGRIPNRRTLWRCQCDCGAVAIVPTALLRNSTIPSCGCAGQSQETALGRRGKLPYGYLWTQAGVVIDEEAASCIQEIDALDRQKLSRKAIAAAMNANYPRRDGRLWNADNVTLILTNRHLYQGAHRGKQTATWPVILEPSARSAELATQEPSPWEALR